MKAFTELEKEYQSKPADYYAGERHEILPFVPESFKVVLDVGCGVGNFGALLKKELGLEVWGIEPDGAASKEAAKKLDRVIQNQFLENIPELKGRYFDGIFFNDVLEHAIQPERLLGCAVDHLAANGRIIASIPNILFHQVMWEVIWRQDWKYVESGILDYTHLRFFTKKSIIRLFESCRLEPISVIGINPCVTRAYRLANALMLNHLRDWKFVQFLVLARRRGEV
jgi:2-polyprenyl-3-methyl-5-hydroxy-6-metoxy-1,4-benzoquinol methylase